MTSLMFELEGYEIDWTEQGARLVDPDQMRLGHNVLGTNGELIDGFVMVGDIATEQQLRLTVIAEHRRMDWHQISDGNVTGPMSPVLALKALITELGLPRVTAWSYNTGLAGYQLIAVEANYSQGRIHAVAVDRGTDVIPVAVFRYWQEN